MPWQQTLVDACRDPDLARKVTEALCTLVESDAPLFRLNVGERSISHRFALHLEPHFDQWDVDCEYNRDGHDPKEIAWGSGDDGEHGSRVYPDVIVHKRGTTRNLLVIELKKSNNPVGDDRDLDKLRSYCQQLRYAHGLFVRLRIADAAGIERACFVYA